MSKKLGKSADDIFSAKPKQKKEELDLRAPYFEKQKQKEEEALRQKEEEAPKEKQARGRPLEHKEGWSKVTVVILDKQIHWLDQLASTIRLNTKAAISRAELIRAAIAAIEESNIDLSHVGSEQAMKDMLLEKLKK